MSDAPVARELSISAYLILGYLRLGPLDRPEHGPRSGYDIKRAVEVSARYFWAISPVQIYPTLRELEEDGLVVGRSEPRGRRRRRVYELTPAGEEALRDWLRRREPLGLELRDLGMLKLLFADALTRDERAELVRALRERSEHLLHLLERASERPARISEAKGDRFPLETLRLGMALQQAMIDFLAALERDVAATPARRRASKR